MSAPQNRSDIRQFIRAVVPRGMRQKIRQTTDSMRSTEAVFTEIYRKGIWGGGDALYSGTGSRGSAADRYVATIQQFIKTNGVASVLDLGCGDFAIGQRIAQVCDTYIGADIVKLVVDENTRRHANDKVSFRHLNIIDDALPAADLVLVRQVLQHLSNAQIGQILAKLRNYRFVIITEHYPDDVEFQAPNRDKVHGSGTRVTMGSAVCLDQPPFSVRSQQLLLDMPGCTAGDQTGIDDPYARGSIRTFLVRV